MTQASVHPDTRKARAKQSAEVFTPPALVNEMLDKLPSSVWRKGKTFCDPAVGNGNFLVEILNRKIAKGHNPLEALQSLYGVDIQTDNIRECRCRLLSIVEKHEKITKEHIEAVFTNIVCVNLKDHPTGSLEYNFEFSRKPKRENVERWLKDKPWQSLKDENDTLDDYEEFDREGEENVFRQMGIESPC